jgi:hypothetical protein
MTKPVPLSDFRVQRHVLEDHEYATGGEEIAAFALKIPLRKTNKMWVRQLDSGGATRGPDNRGNDSLLVGRRKALHRQTEAISRYWLARP